MVIKILGMHIWKLNQSGPKLRCITGYVQKVYGGKGTLAKHVVIHEQK